MKHPKFLSVLAAIIWLSPLPAFPKSAPLDISGILQAIAQMYGVQSKDLPYLENLDDVKKYTLEQMQAMTGVHVYGMSDYKDFQSWGTDARNWQQVLELYQAGTGKIGAPAKTINQQFPVDPNLNTLDARKLQSDYELLQAKTILAARTASQMSLGQIEDQIAYQQKLQQEVDKTPDLKSSVDLQNRLKVESNLIELQALRLIAINNEQQAMSQQKEINEQNIDKAFMRDQLKP